MRSASWSCARAILKAQQALVGTSLRLVVIVGGVEGGGKTEVARRFLDWMDPRGLRVEAYGDPSDEENERPEYWRYWRTLPPTGHGAILVGSWYTRPIVLRTFKEIGSGGFDQALDRIAAFEAMLIREKTVLVKLWLHLSKKDQRRRFNELKSDRDTAWRVTKQDWEFSKKYDRFRDTCERALTRTNLGESAWTVIEAVDHRYRDLAAGEAVASAIEAALTRVSAPSRQVRCGPREAPKISILSRLDLTKRLKSDHAKKFEKQQTRVALLSRRLRKEGRSLICAFEGVDAAGKGGAIRRLLGAIDVRNARSMAVAAPTDEERAQPYLWRFWRQLPRLGKTTIYDRTWYGRVLVERVEGFCAKEDWTRAYAEIAAFEEELAQSGVIVCKFWLQISPRSSCAASRTGSRRRSSSIRSPRTTGATAASGTPIRPRRST